MSAPGDSQWTFETLKEYFTAIIEANDVRYAQRFEASQAAIAAAFASQQTAMTTAFAAQKLSVDAALEAAKTAVNKAEVAAEKRFESVNEFRATLSDQQRNLMPRSEAEILIKALTDKIELLNTALTAQAAQKSGMTATWAYVIAGAGILIGVLSHFIK